MSTAKTNDASSALARRAENVNADGEQTTKAVKLRDAIISMQSQFEMAMPRGAEAVQLVRDAVTCLRTIRHLDRCEQNSVLGALMTCGQLGLRPGVLGHAWPLPFWDSRSGGYKAQLVIGYQGYIELAYRSGKVADIVARTRYANEPFEVDYGLNANLVHKPVLDADPGAPSAYYAIVRLVTGGSSFFVLSHRAAERYRDRHASARTKDGKIVGPWVNDFEAMAQKSCVRQLAKWMPKSAELATALAVDDGVRVDLTPNIDASAVTDHDHTVIDVGSVEQPAVQPSVEDIAEMNAEANAEAGR